MIEVGSEHFRSKYFVFTSSELLHCFRYLTLPQVFTVASKGFADLTPGISSLHSKKSVRCLILASSLMFWTVVGHDWTLFQLPTVAFI
jgi:hypothetical protein